VLWSDYGSKWRGVRVMPTFASLFSGGGGADIGALQAGYTPLWAEAWDEVLDSIQRFITWREEEQNQ
jgi:hypothetical protein